MKSLLLIFSISVLFASFGLAQNRNDLMGPEAKNYKPWKDNSKNSAVVFKATTKRLTGPQAKNKKSWDKSQEPDRYIAVSTSSRHSLKGPKAKNWKPWQSDQTAGKAYTKNDPDEPMPEKQKSRDVEINNDTP